MEEWLRLATRDTVVVTDAMALIQLAADIIGTSIAPTWQEVGQLGAIAAIRTFLNYFLEPDMAELRDSDAEPLKANTADLR